MKRQSNKHLWHGYLAGGLFNEAEIAQRRKEGKILKKKTPQINWYNPIEAPVNDKSKKPLAKEIFWADTDHVLKSRYFLADLTNNDLGMAYELGIAWTINYIRTVLWKNDRKDVLAMLDKYQIVYKQIYAVNSDIRIKTANSYHGIEIPYGYNQYVIGGLLDQGKIFSNFDQAVSAIQKQIASDLAKQKKKAKK